MQVGWIGLGAMGGPMAACVAAAGHAVAGYDVDPDAATRAGVPAAETASAAARGEVVVLMVATPEQGDAVLEEIAGALAPGAVVVVMATVGPAAVERWTARLAEGDVALVDAPVSGGVARARTGELLVMAAGAEVERVRPVLDAVAARVAVVDDGQRVKLVNQLLCGVHIAAAAEALAFAEALGLDAGAVRDVVRGGAAASFMLDDRGERMVEGAFDDVRSALDIFVKDMGLVSAAAEAHGFAAPLTHAARALYEEGARRGLGRRDDSAVIEVLRR